MSDANQLFGQALVKSLVGERGHIRVARALPDIDVELAGKKMQKCLTAFINC